MRKKRENWQNPVQTSARAQEWWPSATLGGSARHGTQIFAQARTKSSGMGILSEWGPILHRSLSDLYLHLSLDILFPFGWYIFGSLFQIHTEIMFVKYSWNTLLDFRSKLHHHSSWLQLTAHSLSWLCRIVAAKCWNHVDQHFLVLLWQRLNG